MSESERKIVYNRTGNLATTTQLNEQAAEKFMRRADMRRDIIIVDSDQRPQRTAVAVSSDTLAMRGVPPFKPFRIPLVISSWKEAPLPIIPIDKWAQGQWVLLRHGNNLVVPR